MEIKHLFFDLDHTLWDFDKNSELCFQQIFEEQSVEVSVKEFLKEYIPINLAYWKLFREEKIGKESLRYRRLKDTFDALKYEITDALINKIAEDYITYLPNNNYLLDGTLEVLEYLNKKYQLHIITNGFKNVQHVKLSKSNIKKYFNVIVTSECVGVKKPNAKIFEYALAQAKAKPEASVMIGDSYEADVLGALTMGMQAVFFNIYNEDVKKAEKTITISSLLELKQYF